jgi:hypothetical protein
MLQWPNKANHGDAHYIAASPPFRSRACWLALNAGDSQVQSPNNLVSEM